MNSTIKRIFFTMLAGLLLITACAPAAPAATQDPAVVQQQIQQAVSLTLAAQNAQATEQQALIAPSNTPLPTQTAAEPPTPTPELLTATPFVIVPPTDTPAVSSGGGGTVIKPDYACDVIDQQPLDNSVWKRNKDFDINWTLVNTGTRNWPQGWDLKYYSGPQMTKVTFVELSKTVKPGEKYKIILDAVTPDAKGHQVMTWSLEGGFCYPYVAIDIE